MYATAKRPPPPARAKLARPAGEDLTGWELECSYEPAARELDRYLAAHRAEVVRLTEGAWR